MAQNILGYMYEHGEGVKQDYKKAFKWYRKAAQHDLGVRYDNGTGVKQDHKEAVAWYRRAADQGHASAQFNLGSMYREG